MLNAVIMMGRIVADPVCRYTQRPDGSKMLVARYRIAVERDYRREGERPVDFFSCKVYASPAEFAKEYFQQGDTIIVSGKLYTYSYKKAGEDQEHIYSTIHVLQNYLVKKRADVGRTRILSPMQDGAAFEQDAIGLEMENGMAEIQMPPLPPFFDDDEPYEAIYADYSNPHV